MHARLRILTIVNLTKVGGIQYGRSDLIGCTAPVGVQLKVEAIVAAHLEGAKSLGDRIRRPGDDPIGQNQVVVLLQVNCDDAPAAVAQPDQIVARVDFGDISGAFWQPRKIKLCASLLGRFRNRLLRGIGRRRLFRFEVGLKQENAEGANDQNRQQRRYAAGRRGLLFVIHFDSLL